MSPASDRPESQLGPDSPSLPAPYESPWGLLGRDLVAVAASLGLRLRELWRRNRQGDLSVPGFWPAALAPLFWPLLLALGLAVAVALPLSLIRAQPQPVGSSAPVSPAADTSAAIEPQSAAPAARPEPPAPAVLELDPLLDLLATDDTDQLIGAARPDPAASRLTLELDSRFAELSANRQAQLAQQWLARAEALGYDQLLLRDAAGQLLGRRARVGSGMILFSAGPEP